MGGAADEISKFERAIYIKLESPLPRDSSGSGLSKVKLVKERSIARICRSTTARLGDVRVGRDVGADISKTMTCGISSFENCSHEWTVRYDEYLYCIDGTFTIKTKEGDFTLEPGDAIWLPEDTWMIYEAKEKARAVMAVAPIDWRKCRGME